MLPVYVPFMLHIWRGVAWKEHKPYLIRVFWAPVAVANDSCACFFTKEKVSDSCWEWFALALIITGVCSGPEPNRVLKPVCSWAEREQCKNTVTFYNSFILMMEMILKEPTFQRTDNYPTKLATIFHLGYTYEALGRFAGSQFTHWLYCGCEL